MIEIIKDGEKMTKQQERTWIGNICSAYLISKMNAAGYDVETIAKVGGYPEAIVRKKIDNVKNARKAKEMDKTN